MVEQISNWIQNGCDYALGVALYAEYGSDLFLKAVFKRGESPINRQKINKALSDILEACTPVPLPEQPKPTPKPAESIPDTPAPAAAENNAQILLQVLKRRDQTGAELRMLQPQLQVLPEGAELHELARRLIRLSKENAIYWLRYNHITETGADSAPAGPPPRKPVMVDLNLLNDRENLRKSLARTKARAASQDKPHKNTLLLLIICTGSAFSQPNHL
jgi:beta-glucosidase-like glycosyl hydrolase